MFLEKMDNTCNIAISLQWKGGAEPVFLQLLYEGDGEQEEIFML